MPKKIRSRLPLLLLILVVGGCTYKLFPGLRDHWGPCPSLIMHIEKTTAEQATFEVYNGLKNTHESVTQLASHDGIYLMPLGYDSSSDSWVFAKFDGFEEIGLGTEELQIDDKEHIVVYRKGKRIPVTLEDLPTAKDLSQANQHKQSERLRQAEQLEQLEQLKQAALLDSHVYIPFRLNGNWVIYRYDLAGKLIQKKVLGVPGIGFSGEDRMAIARNGSVAVNDGSGVCVIDKQDRVIAKIARGSSPQISPDGTMLAYWGDDDNSVTVLNLQTMHSRKVKIWPQPNARLWDVLLHPSVIQMDWENQWLFVAYEQNFSGPWRIYGADISSPIFRWKRLPIVVQWWDWVVINKAPKS